MSFEKMDMSLVEIILELEPGLKNNDRGLNDRWEYGSRKDRLKRLNNIIVSHNARISQIKPKVYLKITARKERQSERS